MSVSQALGIAFDVMRQARCRCGGCKFFLHVHKGQPDMAAICADCGSVLIRDLELEQAEIDAESDNG